MQNDLQPGINVEENPLAKVLEIQTERVLNVLEAAMLQAMSDVRATFNDLSKADESRFEARLYEEIIYISMGRTLSLGQDSPIETSDPRIKRLVQDLRDRLNAFES